jgi:hypothetical protein
MNVFNTQDFLLFSLIINNECNGEDRDEPGGGGESRRIKAFKWFCRYFKVPTGDDRTLSCKGIDFFWRLVKNTIT